MPVFLKAKFLLRIPENSTVHFASVQAKVDILADTAHGLTIFSPADVNYCSSGITA